MRARISCTLIDVVGEQVRFQINPDDQCELRFSDCLIKTRLGTAAGELAALVLTAAVLSIELVGPARCVLFKLGNMLIAPGTHFCGKVRPVGEDQRVTTPLEFSNDFGAGLQADVVMEAGEQFVEIAIASRRDGQDEFQWLDGP